MYRARQGKLSRKMIKLEAKEAKVAAAFARQMEADVTRRLSFTRHL